MTHLRIDRDLCIGSGNCVHFAPTVFSLDDEGIATAAADSEPGPNVAIAVAQCPTGAISVEPEETSSEG